MADSRAGPGQPVVVALGSVDPALVTGVLDGHCRFVPDPGETELGLASGAIVRADTRVDQALLGKAPAASSTCSPTANRRPSPILPGAPTDQGDPP